MQRGFYYYYFVPNCCRSVITMYTRICMELDLCSRLSN